MRTLQRGAQLVLPLGLIACLMVIVIPLPPGVTDMLLALNLCCAAVILLTSVSIQTPLEFSVFPSLLLATTFGRLVLNIATTRLILSSAHASGLDSAGGIIRGFGQFVAGDQLAVGIIIFLILVIVQFVVITKGASRISEVAARFALDGMPGRQVAIDADLNAGSIDQPTARQQREELSRQADFFGAMDGASKYVRGDAIAGILIIVVNIVGGLYMGVIESGMSFRDASDTYLKLAIGDGLVSQLPAFLISLAAGILVSRGSRATNLPREFVAQLVQRPEPLIIAGGFLGLLIFARLPAFPLLLVGGACIALALALRMGDRKGNSQATSSTTEPGPSQTQQQSRTLTAEQCLNVEPLELELGVALLRLADPQRGGDLLERISGLRNRTATELGLVLPKVRIRDNLALNENGYRVRLYGDEIAQGRCYPLRAAVVGLGFPDAHMDAISTPDPISGGQLIWIDPADSYQLDGLKVKVYGACEWIITHLQHLTRLYADELLTRDAVRLLLDRTREAAPAIVNEVVPECMSLAELQQALKSLLSAGLSIRNLPAIFEALCDAAQQYATLEDRILFVRRRMTRSIISQFTSPDGNLLAVTLAQDVEDWFEASEQCAGDDDTKTRAQILDSLISRVRRHRTSGETPVVLVRDSIQSSLQRRLRRSGQPIVVLSRDEIASPVAIKDAGCVSWASLQHS